MKKLRTCLLLLSLFFVFKIDAQVRFTIELLSDCSTYQVSLLPESNYVPPFNLTPGGQITVVVPTGSVVPSTINSQNGTWAFINPRITAPAENPNFDYLNFQLTTPASSIIYQAGVEIPLFSFTNIGTCTGPVNLIDNATDPFSPPNSREANVGNALTILGAFGDAYIGNYTSGNNQCCSDGTTTGGTATGGTTTGGTTTGGTTTGNTGGSGTIPNSTTFGAGCIIQYVLEPIGNNSFQVSLISDTTWTGINAITSTAQVSIRVPTGGFVINNIQNSINVGLPNEVVWLENSRYVAPAENPAWDYYSFGLASFNTSSITYQKGLKVPLFTFENSGSCTGDNIFLIDNNTDPFMAPNSEEANIEQHITVSGWRQEDTPVCVEQNTMAACCDCLPAGTGNTTEPNSFDTGCIIEYVLEQIGTNSFQVSLISDTTWTGFNAITSTAQVSIRVPTGGFVVGNLQNSINTGQSNEVFWLENSRYFAPAEAPAWDYHSFGLASFNTPDITYQQGLKVPLFTFDNIGVCTRDSIFLIDNNTDPFMGPNSEGANIEQHITVSGWRQEDTPVCVRQSTMAACCDCSPPVSNPDPLFSVNAGCAGDASLFTDQTNANNIIAWTWEFGDGVGFSTQQNPSYTYTNSGLYTVTLRVTYMDGEEKAVSNQISICEPTPIVNTPSFFCNTACMGDLTFFSNNTDPTNVVAWAWDFGDGLGMSDLLNPTYTYGADGTYLATLTVHYLDGSQQNISKEVIVRPMVWPLVRTTKETICIGECVRLQAQGGSNYNWSSPTTLDDPSFFSPVACPTSTTTYTVTISNDNGCSAIGSIEIFVAPPANVIANNDISICNGESINLGATGEGAFQWSPVNTLNISSIRNPIASPTTTTEYCVTLTDASGCTASDCMVVTVLDPSPANAGIDRDICIGESVALSASGGSTYQWSPSAGLDNSNIPNPIATPSATTTYCVTTTDINGCIAEDCMTINVNSATGSINEGQTICPGASVQMNATGGVSYNWSPAISLNNADISNPIASPMISTEYCVTVTDINACTDIQCTTIIVSTTLTANAGNDVLTNCPGQNTQLNASGGLTYEWSPSQGLSNTSIPNPMANPTTTTTYCVTATDAAGCIDSDCVVVTIGNGLQANAGDDVTLCTGEFTILSASGGSFYQWSPAINLSNATVNNPIATPTATTTYCVTVTDATGCTATDCVNIIVSDNNSASAGNDVNICTGGSAQLLASGGSSYSWSPANGLSSTTISNPISNPSATTTYCVTITDNNGCITSDCVNVIVGNSLNANAGNSVDLCTGETTQLSASGGVNYQWSPSASLSTSNSSNPVASPSRTTTYCVTVSDASGCTDTDCVTVTVGNNVEAFAGNDIAICSGETTQLLAAGGSSFQWSPSAGVSNPFSNNPLVTPTSTTTYCVTVSDANGCTDTDCVIVTVSNSVNASAGNDLSLCAGGSSQLNASGGMTYQWSPTMGLSNATSSNPVVTPAFNTTYCVTVSDASGCTDTDCVTVNVSNSLNAFAGNDATICTGSTTTLNASGGTSYQWSPTSGLSNAASSNPIASPNTTTTYCVTVSDANGCTDTDCVTINVGNSLNAFAGSDATICTGSITQLNASGGTSYQWSPTNGLSNVATSNPMANPTTTTTYCVTVSDVNGCTDTDCVTINVGNSLNAFAGSDATICTGSTTQLNASGGTSYQWSPTSGLSNAASSNPIASPTTTTTYCVTVSDANGCTDTDCVTISIGNTLNAFAGNDATICTGSTTQLTASGGTSYQWSPTSGLSNATSSNPIASPTTTTTYCVTVSDASGCMDTDCVTISIGNSLNAFAGNDATICTGSTTRLNASGGTSYQWSPTNGLSNAASSNPIANPTTTTTYCVTVSDASGCTDTDCVTINIGNSPTAFAGNDATICTGSTTTLNASGGTSYQWSPTTGLNNAASSNPIANPTTTTTYCVTVSNASGCTDTDCVTVNVGNSATAFAGNDVTICTGSSTPLNATSGTAHQWSPTTGLSNAAIRTPIASPSTTTTYCVTITDANGCTGTDCVTVNVGNSLTASAGNAAAICTGSTTQLNASGGTIYQWSPTSSLSNAASSNPIASPTTTTTYCVTVSDANGCSDAACVTISVGNSPTAFAGNDATICMGSTTRLNASGGTSYQWSPTTGLSNSASSNPIASPTTTTTYCVTVSDANGCTDTDCVTVNVGNSTSAFAGNDATICTGSTTRLNASGGTSYQWSPTTSLSNAASSNPIASPTTTTTYCVTVSDVNGCTDTDCVTINIGNSLTASAGNAAAICTGSTTQLNASGGTIYQWSPTNSLSNAAISNPIASPTTTTTYCATVSDANGCSDVACVTISVGNSLNAFAGNDATICTGSTTRLNASGGTSYQWSPTTGLSNAASSSPIANPTTTTTYCVTVSNASGCTDTDCVTINIGNSPTAFAGNDVSICTGSSTPLNATSGAAHQWSPTTGLSNAAIRTPIASPSTTTTYCVTITDANGCTNTDCVTVNVGSSINAFAGNDASICTGSSTPLNASNGTAHQWSPTTGLSNATIRNPIASPSTTTTYCVTITDANGCTDTDCTTINVLNTLTANAGTDVDICNGRTTTLNASGGTSYSWSPATGLSNAAIRNPIANPTTSTTYCVTVSGTGGCAAIDCVRVTVGNALNASAGNDATVCSGNSTQLNATGGVSYRWSPVTGLSNAAIRNPIANPTATTTYCVTVSDASGCTDTDCTTINVTNTVAANVGNDINICSGSSTQLNASGGTSYQWSPTIGLSNAFLSNPIASPSSSTTYCVTITSPNACAAIACLRVNVDNNLTATAGNDAVICPNSSTQLSASGGIRYQWSPTTGLSNAAIANPIARPNISTNYCVTVTDANGCTGTDCTNISISNNISVSAGNDVMICANIPQQLGASGGISYQWSPTTGLSNPNVSNPFANPASNTTYCVTVTDASGCTGVDCVAVAVGAPALGNAGPDVALCSGSTTQLQASGGISYQWSPTTGLSNPNIANPIVSTDFSTDYCVTVTDASGCTSTDCTTISILKLHGSAGIDRTICSGESIQLNATGGVNYQWTPTRALSNPNISNPFANPTETTIYCVTFSADGCSETNCMTITVDNSCEGEDNPGGGGTPAFPCENGIIATACEDKFICPGETAQLVVNGGTNWLWTPANTLNNPFSEAPLANPIVTTNYSVTVTDANGCTGIDQVTVFVENNCDDGTPQPCTNGPNVIACEDKSICPNESVQLIVTTGASYQWIPATTLSDPFIGVPIANPRTTTTYFVTVTDANGCTGTDQVTIFIKPDCDTGGSTPQVCTSSPLVITCEDKMICRGEKVRLTVNTGASYAWSPANTLDNAFVGAPLANPSTTTTYTVTVTDTDGCTGTDQVVVNVTEVNVSAGEDQSSCAGAAVQLSARGGTSYRWSPVEGLSNPTIANPIATTNSTTTYCVTVSDINGCLASDCMQVFVGNSFGAVACEDKTICRNGNIQLTVTSGAAYQWSPATGLSNTTIGTPIASPTQTTTYTVIVTDEAGCTSEDQVVVNVDPTCTGGRECPEDILPEAQIEINLTDCQLAAELCLPIPVTELDNYIIKVNDTEWSKDNFKTCQLNYAFAYTYFTVPDRGNRGPYVLNNWTINGVSYTGDFDTIEELIDLMNQFDPIGNWIVDASTLTLKGGKETNEYSSMQIQQVQRNAFATLEINVNITPSESMLVLPVGTQSLTIMQKETGCTANTVISVNCPTQISCPSIFAEERISNQLSHCEELVEICLNFPLLEAANYSYLHNGETYQGSGGFCETQSGNTAIYVGYGNHELIVTHLQTGCADTVFVKNSCVMEATYVAETIVTQEQGQYCFSTGFDETIKSITNNCQEISGQSVFFAIDQLSNCVTFEGIQEGNESACIVVCDDKDICDTTYLTVHVIPISGVAPEAGTDEAVTDFNSEIDIDVIANDRSTSTILSIEITAAPKKGRVQIKEDLSLSYLPDADYCDTQNKDEFTYRICNNYGCSDAQVQVMVSCAKLEVFSGFSPNNDNINDYFKIEGIEHYPNNELQVFNRWGSLVFSQKGYSNNWDGTYKNAPLTDGVYFYVLRDGRGNQLSGFVQLNR